MPTSMTPDEVRVFLMGDTAPPPSRPSLPVVKRPNESPRDRAKMRGWSIDPELTPGNPHLINECSCRRRRASDDPQQFCQCACHGRTFQVNRRGA